MYRGDVALSSYGVKQCVNKGDGFLFKEDFQLRDGFCSELVQRLIFLDQSVNIFCQCDWVGFNHALHLRGEPCLQCVRVLCMVIKQGSLSLSTLITFTTK